MLHDTPDDSDEGKTAPAVAAVEAPAKLLMASPLIGRRETGAVFNRKPRTISNWVRAGHLHPVRIGRAVFFRREEVEALAGMRSGYAIAVEHDVLDVAETGEAEGYNPCPASAAAVSEEGDTIA